MDAGDGGGRDIRGRVCGRCICTYVLAYCFCSFVIFKGGFFSFGEVPIGRMQFYIHYGWLVFGFWLKNRERGREREIVRSGFG